MSDQPAIGAEDAISAKRHKLSEQYKNVNAIGAAVVEAEGTPLRIFDLNINCYEAVADWLSMEDLYAFGQTCKYHQRVAGDIFKKVYSAAHTGCTRDGIYIVDEFWGRFWERMNGSCDLIRHLIIDWGHMDCFRFIESHSFALIKRIRLFNIELTDEKIACIKKILKKVEIVELTECKFDGEFHDKFLQFCESMKRLTVWPSYRYGNMESEGPGFVIATNNDWLLREYPKLERFEMSGFRYNSGTPPTELKMFLQRNPNIQHFATDFKLWKGEEDVGLKLDVLAINCFGTAVLEYYSKLDETKRFFKRLHIYSDRALTQSDLKRLNSSNQIEKLYMHQPLIESLSLNNLKEIRISIRDAIDLETAIVNGNPNLERVSLSNARIVDMLAFICGSPKLIKLRIECFDDTVQEDERILDLSELNNQRTKLNRARKLTIYVKEDVFLATKWATHTTDCSLVRLERDQSHDWNHDFVYD